MSETRVLLATDLTFARPHPADNPAGGILRMVRDYARRSVTGLHNYAKSLGADGAYYMANRGSVSGWQLRLGILNETGTNSLEQGAVLQSWLGEKLRILNPNAEIDVFYEMKQWEQQTKQKYPYLVLGMYRHKDNELTWLKRLRGRSPHIPITWQYTPDTLQLLQSFNELDQDNTMQITPEVWGQLQVQGNGSIDHRLLREHRLRLCYHVPTTRKAVKTTVDWKAIRQNPGIIRAFEGTFGREDIGNDATAEVRDIQAYIDGQDIGMVQQLERLKQSGVKLRRIIVGVPLAALSQALGSKEKSDLEAGLKLIINRTRHLT